MCHFKSMLIFDKKWQLKIKMLMVYRSVEEANNDKLFYIRISQWQTDISKTKSCLSELCRKVYRPNSSGSN